MVTLHSLNPIGTHDTQNDTQIDTQKITIVDYKIHSFFLYAFSIY